jgi:hypothetical protein
LKKLSTLSLPDQSMSKNLSPKEVLVRVIKRMPEDIRQKGKLDFIRSKNYLKTGKPENGFSLLRKAVMSLDEMYAYVKAFKWLKGAAECQLDKLEKVGLKYLVTGDKSEHVSLRCSDCDMAVWPNICQPTDKSICPLFRNDPFALDEKFKLVDPIKLQATPISGGFETFKKTNL